MPGLSVRYATINCAVTLNENGGELVDVVNVVENIRVIKSEEELVYIRQGARIVEEAMDAALKKTFTGSNENDVAAAVYEILCKRGSQWAGLPCYLACGPRSGLCHSTWSGKIASKQAMSAPMKSMPTLNGMPVHCSAWPWSAGNRPGSWSCT